MNSNQPIGLVGRVIANGPGNRGSIPGRLIPKTQKVILDASLLNTQHYKVRIKSKISSIIRLYYQSFPAGLLDYIECSYRAIVGKFLLVVQYL